MLQAVNVSSVKQLSPFRYPGGKTWLIPIVRQWLAKYGGSGINLIEPFAGGGIVSLTAASEDLVARCTMVELDVDITALWSVALNGQAELLAKKIRAFHFSKRAVKQLLKTRPRGSLGRALQVIVRNRASHNGIMAPGAGLLKGGENGYGLGSRWYPETIASRIEKIGKLREKIEIIGFDGIQFIKHRDPSDCIYFIDPPYSAAGQRLYRHGAIDHDELFAAITMCRRPFILTYSHSAEIVSLAERYGFKYTTVLMRAGTKRWKTELVVTDNLSWCEKLLSRRKTKTSGPAPSNQRHRKAA